MKHVPVSITCAALAVPLTPYCHPVPLRARRLTVNHKGGKQGTDPEVEETESCEQRQKIVRLQSPGKLFVSQMSMWFLLFVDNLYVDKCHKMKHYRNFYSLENILLANTWLDISLYLFQYLRNSA